MAVTAKMTTAMTMVANIPLTIVATAAIAMTTVTMLVTTAVTMAMAVVERRPRAKENLDLARSGGLDEARRVAAGRARPPIFLESERGRRMFDAGWATKMSMGLERYCAALEGAAASDLPPQEPAHASRGRLAEQVGGSAPPRFHVLGRLCRLEVSGL